MQADLVVKPGQAIKALTLTQPWATLLAHGRKRIETRSWVTNYRGLIAIHAAKTMPNRAQLLCYEDPPATLLRALDYWSFRDLPLGAIVGFGVLYDCQPITPALVSMLPDQERALGHYAYGRFAWRFEELRGLQKPIPARGAQGLWTWTVEELP